MTSHGDSPIGPADDDAEPLHPDVVAPPDGGLGGFDLGSLLGAAQDMTAKMAEAQEAMTSTEVVGTAGGGMVAVTLDGAYGIHDVTIDASVVDPGDPAMLEDLVMAAFRDALGKVAELQSTADPMAGLDLGSLGDLFGG